ncbi:MAG: AsmA family protein, partial [Rhodospirillales bacterium]
MRKVLYGLIGVVVVAVAAALVLPSLIDARALVRPVLQSVKDQTGREVRLGSIGLSLLPPAATLGDLAVANIPGAANPDMLRVKSAEVRVALLPLLSGRVEVSSIAIADPVVAIETLRDGRSSLDFPKRDASGAQADVRLDQVAVRNGLVILRDAGGGERRIEAINATAAAESLSGPFRAKGSARTMGIAVNLDAAAGRLEPGKPTQINLALDGAGARAQFQGTATSPAAPGPNAAAAIAGKFALTAANLASFADQLNAGGAALPPLAAQAFAMEGSVKGTTGQISAPDIAVTLGEMRGTGALALGLGQRTTVQLALNLGRIDLDKLLAQAGAPAPASAAAKALPPQAAGAPAGPAIPPDLVAAIDIGIEAIAYRGQAMQQARLLLDVVNGVATVKQLGARLPAGSSVLVANLPLPLGGQAPAIPDGRVEAHSDNLRGLLEWLGADLSSIPAGRVGRFDLKASVRSDGRTVQIANLDATLDSSRLTGGASMAWRGRPGLGVRANLDRINLDAYLPCAGAKARPAAAPAGAPGGSLQALESFDLDLLAEVGTLTWRETPIQGVKLAMDLVGGRLNVKELSARDLAGAQGELKLQADKLSTNPAFSTAYSLRAPDSRRLIKFMSGVDAPPAAGAAGALSLSGTAAGTRDEFKIDTAMQGLGGQARIAGSLAQLTQQAPKVDLGIDAAFPELSPVLVAFAGTAAKHGQQKLGPVSLKSRLVNTGPDSIALRQTELKAFGGAMTAEGTVGKLLTPEPSVDLALAINLPSLRPLLTAFNPDPQLMAMADQLGALNVAGKAAGSARKMTLRDAAMKGLGGAVRLGGDILDMGRRYDLSADIQGFNVGPLIAALPGPVMTAPGARQLGPMTGKVAIKGPLDNLSVGMQNLAMRGFGGTMALNGSVADAAEPSRKLDLTFDLDKVELGQMIAAFPAAGASPALAAGLRTATIKGAVKGAGNSPSLTLNPATVQAFGGTVAVNGTVSDAASPAAKYDLTASANVPSLHQMLAAFYRPAMQMAGPLKFDNVRLVGDGKRVRIDNLVGILGPMGVSAQGFFTLDGKRPRLEMELKTSGELFVDAFLPLDVQRRGDLMPYWRMLFPGLLPAADERVVQLAQTQAAPAPQAQPYKPVQIAAPPPPNAPVDPRWSRAPFNLDGLKAYDANLKLSGVQSIRFRNYSAQNLTALVTVADGVATVSKIAGTAFGGGLAGDIAFNANNVPRGDLRLTLTRANAHELMKAVANNDKVDGWISTDAKFQFQGRNEAETVSSLNGGAALQGDVKARISGTERLLVGGVQGLGGLLGGTNDSAAQTMTSLSGGKSS